MKAFPFDAYSFRIVTIERPNLELQQLMQTNGYEKVCNLEEGVETLWVKSSEKASLDFTASVVPSKCRLS